MTRKQPKDTDTFKYVNLNPKNRFVSDCVVRALAGFLRKSWDETFKMLAEWGFKKACAMDEPNCYATLLKRLGYEKQPMPRKFDRSRYTAREFCAELADCDCVYILSLAGHLTLVQDMRICDTWDCGDKSVGNYWVRYDVTR